MNAFPKSQNQAQGAAYSDANVTDTSASRTVTRQVLIRWTEASFIVEINPKPNFEAAQRSASRLGTTSNQKQYRRHGAADGSKKGESVQMKTPSYTPRQSGMRAQPCHNGGYEHGSAPAREPARLPNNEVGSCQTSNSRSGSLYTKLATIIAAIVLAVNAPAQTEVGEIVSRPAPQGTEAAMSVLQNARDNVQKKLANIAAQGDGLADAVAKYKTAPTTENALALLKREAVTAGVGAREADGIAADAASAAKTCAGLAAQTLAAAETLRPGLDKAMRAQTEYAGARNTGFGELREVHRQLQERGITSDASLSPAEKRKIATLLRLSGAADLAERFLKMEAGATEATINRLTAMSEQFSLRQRNFDDLSKSYQLHAQSFRVVGGSVARVAQVIENFGRFDGEAKAAAELEGDLARIDDVLGKTFQSLPDDFTPVFMPTPHAAGNAAEPGSSGIWSRLLRFLGISDGPKPEVAQTGGKAP